MFYFLGAGGGAGTGVTEQAAPRPVAQAAHYSHASFRPTSLERALHRLHLLWRLMATELPQSFPTAFVPFLSHPGYSQSISDFFIIYYSDLWSIITTC